MKTTLYSQTIRQRSDRAWIRDEWIVRVIRSPEREALQSDGRIRRWGRVPEAGSRALRVVLLADGETVTSSIRSSPWPGLGEPLFWAPVPVRAPG